MVLSRLPAFWATSFIPLHSTPTTAILLFLRPAAEEARSKGWQGNRRQDEQIAARLIAHTKAAAEATRLPVIIRASAQQRGCSFGERLANAIEDVFALGYRQIVTLGTDTPDISAEAILEVARRIQPGILVTGPALDGGIYTLGISACDWNREDFLKIGWQTGGVQKGLAQCASANHLAQTVLAPLADLDGKKDLQIWLRNAATGKPLAKLLSCILCAPATLLPAAHSPFRLPAISAGNGYCGPPAAGR